MTDGDDDSWLGVDGNARRRILAHTPEMMVVEVEFGIGGYGALHAHPHVQASYVRSGRFEYVIDGRAQILVAGQSVIVPSNARHGCTALEPGTLIDVFTPCRLDFLPTG